MIGLHGAGWRMRGLPAVLIAVAGLSLQSLKVKPVSPTGDQPLYLSIAYELAISGQYTDGTRAVRRSDGSAEAGSMIAPLYPALLAGLMRIDPVLAATAQCVVAPGSNPAACPSRLGLLVPLQAGMVVATLLLVWLSALRLHADPRVAWAALILAALSCQDYAYLVHAALTDVLSCLLFAAFCLGLLITVQTRSVRAAIAAGALLGFAALTRPAFLYVAYAFIPVWLMVVADAIWRRGHWQSCLRCGFASLAGVALIVTPWILRNAVLLGTADLTRGYGGYILAQRVAYDAMTLREYLVGWIYWLPDFGDSLAKSLFSPELYRRLGWEESADTFYAYGNRVLAPETLAAAGEPSRHVGYLVRHYILAEPGRYIAVTLLLAWRGLWVGKYFALVTAPLLLARLIADIRRRQLDLLVFAAPPVFMLFFNAAVSVSIPRYNLVLIPSLSVAAAMSMVGWLDRLRPSLTPIGRFLP
jgi:hypothetical protein